VRYADDFVLLCRVGVRPRCAGRLEAYLGAKGLRLNAAKTRTLDVQHESFRFSGLRSNLAEESENGRHYVHMAPSSKSQALSGRRCGKHSITGRWGKVARPKCAGSNAVLRGWGGYFYYGHCTRTFRRVPTLDPGNGCVHGCGRSMVAPTRAMVLHQCAVGWSVWTVPTPASCTLETDSRPVNDPGKAGCGKPARPV